MRVGSVVLVALAAVSAVPGAGGAERWCSVGPHASATGDVDGDGVAERVWLSGGRRVELECLYVLRAAGPRDRWSTTVVAWSPQPTIPSVRNIDGRPGAEIDVVVDRGASSATSSVYTVRGRTLRRMTFAGSPRVMSFLAAGMHFGGADCIRGRPGTIAAVSVERLRSSFRVVRSTLRADGLGFRVVGRGERVVRTPPRVGMSFESCPR